MRLRSYFVITSVLLLAAVVASTGTLMWTTEALADVSRELAGRIAHADAAREVAKSIGTHRRRDLLWELSRTPETLARLEESEADLREKLGRLAAAADAEDAPEVEVLSRHVRGYLAAVRQVERTTGSVRAAQLEKPFEEAREALFQHVHAQLATATRLTGTTRRLESNARVFGVLVLAVAALGTLLIVASLRRRLVVPVETLLAALRRLRGDPQSEARMPALAGEWGELAGALDEMSATIRRQRAQQVTFLSAVAHDLKNPLAAMKLQLQVLARRGGDPERLKRMTGVLQQQVEALDRQVTDLLEATRIQGGRFSMVKAPADLAGLVRDAVKLFERHDGRHTFELDVPETLPCTCDTVRVGQVLGNLLGNAVKYSPSGGTVRVTARRTDERCVVTVADEGIGIAPEDLAHLFEPFRRGRVEALGIPGTGLGLSVARRLVEAHGGRIEVESTVGQGATFRVILPVHGGVPNATATAPAHVA